MPLALNTTEVPLVMVKSYASEVVGNQVEVIISSTISWGKIFPQINGLQVSQTQLQAAGKK